MKLHHISIFAVEFSHLIEEGTAVLVILSLCQWLTCDCLLKDRLDLLLGRVHPGKIRNSIIGYRRSGHFLEILKAGLKCTNQILKRHYFDSCNLTERLYIGAKLLVTKEHCLIRAESGDDARL